MTGRPPRATPMPGDTHIMKKLSAARRPTLATAVAATAVLLTAGPASAHVEVESESTQALAQNVEIAFDAESESATAGITEIRVVLPEGIAPADVAYGEGPKGWALTVNDDGYTVKGPAVKAGVNAEYSVVVKQLPDAKELPFKTIQTYGDGQVDRWIELDENGENPAPVLKLKAAAAGATPIGSPPPARPSPRRRHRAPRRRPPPRPRMPRPPPRRRTATAGCRAAPGPESSRASSSWPPRWSSSCAARVAPRRSSPLARHRALASDRARGPSYAGQPVSGPSVVRDVSARAVVRSARRGPAPVKSECPAPARSATVSVVQVRRLRILRLSSG